MTEVLSATSPTIMSTAAVSPAQCSDSSSSIPSKQRERTQPSERVLSYAQNRRSTTSQQSRHSSLSRSSSVVYPAFHSSLPYALVRDFAYSISHPMHYGTPPEPPSGSTTPGSEWNTSRRSSDPLELFGKAAWGAVGPWDGHGVSFNNADDGGEPLPSTSFGQDDEGAGGIRRGQQRKRNSYAHITDFERGRRRESGHRRMSQYSVQQTDPAGRDSLRHSRSYGSSESNGSRRDSHFVAATLLPPRSFHDSQATNAVVPNPDDDMPLDSEDSAHFHSPQRDSIGPEDEELFAGESLALYSFEPENANELRLSEGQHILVSYRHGQGWLVAEDKETGEQGLVPEAYVRLISDIPNYDPELRTFVNVEEGAEEDDMEDPEDDHELEDDDTDEEETDRTPASDLTGASRQPDTKVQEDR